MSSNIYTIGHSTLDSETFTRNLQLNGITAVADVRSTPYSRFNPQYNRETLSKTLADHGIRYVFLGKELGARSEDESCYVDDRVQYHLLAQTELFRSGLARVVEGSTSFRIALMCAEKDPLDCHRTILVTRELEKRGHQVQHIHADGSVESHQHAMSRLINQLLLQGGDSDLFQSDRTLLEKAYDDQAERIAYHRKA
jgi:uncharacterized protein (DUF488 family)